MVSSSNAVMKARIEVVEKKLERLSVVQRQQEQLGNRMKSLLQ